MNRAIARTVTALAAATLLASTACSGADRADLADRPVITAPVDGAATSGDGSTAGFSANDVLGRTRVSVLSNQPTAEPFDFEAPEIVTGETVAGLDLYAQRPLIIAFMAPWCPICNEEAGFLADVAARDDVNVVVAHGAASDGDIQVFITEHGLADGNVTNLDDTNGALWTRFNVVSQPMFLLVHEDGRLASSVGGLGEHGLARAVELLTS